MSAGIYKWLPDISAFRTSMPMVSSIVGFFGALGGFILPNLIMNPIG